VLRKKVQKDRESGFDLSFSNDSLPKYNGLYDRNLRHHFENRRIQKQLHNVGLIDREGRVLDLNKNKSKLHIIEQEFKFAEKAEAMRQVEEEEMRRRVQKSRYDTLDKARQVDRLSKMKQDRRIRQEILRATRGPDFSSVPSAGRGRGGGGGGGGGGGRGGGSLRGSPGATFLTDGGGGGRMAGADELIDDGY
jgi:hypothetical protein